MHWLIRSERPLFLFPSTKYLRFPGSFNNFDFSLAKTTLEPASLQNCKSVTAYLLNYRISNIQFEYTYLLLLNSQYMYFSHTVKCSINENSTIISFLFATTKAKYLKKKSFLISFLISNS